jgi:hypothetical protein
MTTETILLLILIVFLIGVLPAWPYSRSWGYSPTGVFTLFLFVFLIWAVAGGRPLFRSSGGNIESSLRDAGQNIKSAGRDVADSIRDTVE